MLEVGGGFICLFVCGLGVVVVVFGLFCFSILNWKPKLFPNLTGVFKTTRCLTRLQRVPDRTGGRTAAAAS